MIILNIFFFSNTYPYETLLFCVTNLLGAKIKPFFGLTNYFWRKNINNYTFFLIVILGLVDKSNIINIKLFLFSSAFKNKCLIT